MWIIPTGYLALLCFNPLICALEDAIPKASVRVRNVYDTYGSRDLPVLFRAPSTSAQDHWRQVDTPRQDWHYTTQHPSRRTFYNPFAEPYLSPFFNLMNTMFGSSYPLPTTEPFPYPYDYRTHPTPVIPPPKPLRANVIKLEALNQAPVYPTLDYPTTTKYYPHFVNLLNQVLLENALQNQQKTSLERPEVNAEVYIPTSKPKTNITFKKYPGSIQDQLPPAQEHESTEIPYVASTTQLDARGQTPRDRVVFPSTEPTTSIIIPRSGKPEAMLTEATETYTIKAPVPDIENITRLTIRGLTNNQTVTNLPKIMKPFNMSTVIIYEMERLKQTRQGKNKMDTSWPVDLNDELSLDAKILRDTNWDGYQRPATNKTNQTAIVETRITKSITKTLTNETSPNISYLNKLGIQTPIVVGTSDSQIETNSVHPETEVKNKPNPPDTETNALENFNSKENVTDQDNMTTGMDNVTSSSQNNVTETPIGNATESYALNNVTGDLRIQINTESHKNVLESSNTEKSVTEHDTNNETQQNVTTPRGFGFRRTVIDVRTQPNVTDGIKHKLRFGARNVTRNSGRIVEDMQPNKSESATPTITTEQIRRLDGPDFNETNDIGAFFTEATPRRSRKYSRRPKATSFTPYTDPETEKTTVKYSWKRKPGSETTTAKYEIMKYSDDEVNRNVTSVTQRRDSRYYGKRRRYSGFVRASSATQNTTLES